MRRALHAQRRRSPQLRGFKSVVRVVTYITMMEHADLGARVMWMPERRAKPDLRTQQYL